MSANAKLYSIKEAFFTLQGEGRQVGRASVFCRFTGCNLWTGQEKHRAQAICKFCDTDFVGMDGQNGGKYSLTSLVDQLDQLWQGQPDNKYVVFTGGEPLLQLDEALINAMQIAGFEVGVESNGTIVPPKGINWLCISPKAGSDLTHLASIQGQELKLVYPQYWPLFNDDEAMLTHFSQLNFKHFYLQPKMDALYTQNLQACIALCKRHTNWRLSLQTHKIIGID